MQGVVRALPLLLISMLGGCGTLMQGPAQTVNVDVYPKTASQVSCVAGNERGSYTLDNVPSSLQVDRAYGPLSIKCHSVDGWVGELLVSSQNNTLAVVGDVATGPVSVVQDIRRGGVFTYPNSVVVRMSPTLPPPLADAMAGPIQRAPVVYAPRVHRQVRHHPHVVTSAPSK